MPVALGWEDIGLRLLLTLLAGAALGWDRSAKGHAAGLKTTILVALAACLSMLQANLLLDTAGKPPGSFVSLDMMRLPLGVLTGVGFIGGGAILKDKGEVVGLTTAATLWTVTILGLGFGGGQIGLSLVGTAIAFAVLRGLRPVERRLREKRLATLLAEGREAEFDLDALLAGLAGAGLQLARLSVARDSDAGLCNVKCGLAYQVAPGRHGPPADVAALLERVRAAKWEWRE